ncbi:putative autophagy-related protein 11 [Hetaerina americana]|uniref:putative autophagy-related protein 11 n=1 Tax=Hetaerina americana TaxID=62018 RepID=UPI003A7F4DC8
MHGTVEILHEELRISKDLERSERYRDNSMHDLLNQQQCVIDELVGIKDENIKLSTHNIEVENTCKGLQRKLDLAVKEHEEELNNLKNLHSKEKQDILKKSEDEVLNIKRELEKNQLEFHQCYKEIANKLEALKNERDEQVNLLIAEYEGKLQRSNELLASVTMENKNLRERASANMSIYQKKLLELEKENAMVSLQAYDKNSSIKQNVNQNFKKSKEYGTSMASNARYVQNATDSSVHVSQVNNKQQQQDIKKYFAGGQNSLGMISEPQDRQGFSEDYLEVQKETPASNSRRNVAFPIIKKKKLFTPAENNYLQP